MYCLFSSWFKLISKSIEEVKEHKYPLIETNIEVVVKPNRKPSKKTVTPDKVRSDRRSNEIKKNVVRNEKPRSKAKRYKTNND